jgi:uncharacterized membrane protein YqhA
MPPVQRRFERMLDLSRLLVLIPVVFLLLDATGSFIYGTDILVRTATGVLGEPAHVGGRLGLFLIVMDTFLVGATLMIAAFGFYELFVLRGDDDGHKFWLPGWLRMRDLEDLKAIVVSMLILVAAITFVDRAVESKSEEEVLFLGVGISIIVAALTVFLRFGRRESPPSEGSALAADGPVRGSGGEGFQRSGSRDQAPTESTKDAGNSAGSAEQRAVRRRGDWSGTNPVQEEPNPRRARVTTILGSTKRAGSSISATDTVVTALAGWARLDLRDALRPGQQIRVSVRVGLGAVSITIQPDMDVAESGMTLLGIRRIADRSAGWAEGARPLLILSDRCVLGVILLRRKALE